MIFKPQKDRKIFFLIIVILLAGISCLIWRTFNPFSERLCPDDVKLCPDGSYVGHIKPNCEFEECPLPEEKLSNFGNSQIEKAIINYLLSEEYFSWKTEDNSYSFCGIENLDSENELFPLYIWVYCGEYIIQDSGLKTLSGFSGPAKINYPNELSFYDLSEFSYEVPGDGSQYVKDIEQIFPAEIRAKIFSFERRNIIERVEKVAHTNILSWELIQQAVDDCEVRSVWQTHDKTVGAKLKNGEELIAVEPEIDDIMKIVEIAEIKCGEILMATE